MSTFSQKDILSLFVGGAALKSTGGIDTLNDGEIGIFTPSGTRLTEATAATTDKFIIVRGKGANEVPYLSNIINKADIRKEAAIRKASVAETFDTYTVGFDGANGAVDAIDDNDYHLRLNLVQNRVSNHGGLYIKHGWYKSDTSAIELEIVTGLVKSVIDDFSKEPDNLITVYMYSDAASAAAGAATLVAGSKYVQVATPANFEVGGLLRAGSGTTSEVYFIKSIVGNVVELDVPVNTSGTTAEAISKADAEASSCGLKIKVNAPKRVTGKLANDLDSNRLNLTTEGFGSTPVAKIENSAPGVGNDFQVAELEWFMQGNEGDIFRMGEPNLYERRKEVVAGTTYTSITFPTGELYKGSVVTGPINKAFMLCIPEDGAEYADSGQADDITDVLEVLIFGSVNGNLSM